jgi:hypothetical protein
MEQMAYGKLCCATLARHPDRRNVEGRVRLIKSWEVNVPVDIFTQLKRITCERLKGADRMMMCLHSFTGGYSAVL